MPFLIQVLQSLVVLLAAPLYAGVITRAEAVVTSRRGPSVLQPYRDLAKLLRKGSAVSDQASWVFRGAPSCAGLGSPSAIPAAVRRSCVGGAPAGNGDISRCADSAAAQGA